MAAAADRFAVVRSVHHEAALVHEAGLCDADCRLAEPGTVVLHFEPGSRLEGPAGVRPTKRVPLARSATPVRDRPGQSAGPLGAEHARSRSNST